MYRNGSNRGKAHAYGHDTSDESVVTSSDTSSSGDDGRGAYMYRNGSNRGKAHAYRHDIRDDESVVTSSVF